MALHSDRPKVANVLITGGGTGIGFAIADQLARLGIGISIAGRRVDVLQSAKETLDRTAGRPVNTIVSDVAADNQANFIIEQHSAHFGPIDALVCAAGIYEPTSFLDTTAESWDRVMNVNLRGSMLLALEAAKSMAERRIGRIMFIGSVVGKQSEPRSAAYSASKAALTSLTKSMAIDLATYGIQVNCIAPGWVRTPMAEAEIDAVPRERMALVNPMARAAEPEEIASVATFLIERAPDFLTGQTIYLDGGQTVRAPTLE